MNRSVTSSYYDKMFRKGADLEWDKAPGKVVVLNAVKDILANFSDKVTILDIGCGSGYMLSIVKNTIQRSEIRLVGIDISEVAICIAKQKYPDIEFYVGDGIDTGFQDGSIDMVIGYGSYEHFNDPKSGIVEMMRILKPRGFYLLMIPVLRCYRVDKVGEGWYGDHLGQPQWNLFRETWESYFLGCGFQVDLILDPQKYGAINPGCFFFGRKS